MYNHQHTSSILETIRSSALTQSEVQAIETGLAQLSLRMGTLSRVEALATITLELGNAQLLLEQLQNETTKRAETTVEALNRLDDSTANLVKKVVEIHTSSQNFAATL